ncbi:hypothetical protein [Snodgrassella alvi]|uniref:hypothetical protein n=1 Tax=Snodgrassella alvi TaxID=1196083 RepID=UPI00403C5617
MTEQICFLISGTELPSFTVTNFVFSNNTPVRFWPGNDRPAAGVRTGQSRSLPAYPSDFPYPLIESIQRSGHCVVRSATAAGVRWFVLTSCVSI